MRSFIVSGMILIVLVWMAPCASAGVSSPDHNNKEKQTPTALFESGSLAILAQGAKQVEQTEVTPAGAPKINFPDTLHDFGVVAQSTSNSYTFRVQNTGDAPLKLIKAKGS